MKALRAGKSVDVANAVIEDHIDLAARGLPRATNGGLRLRVVRGETKISNTVVRGVLPASARDPASRVIFTRWLWLHDVHFRPPTGQPNVSAAFAEFSESVVLDLSTLAGDAAAVIRDFFVR